MRLFDKIKLENIKARMEDGELQFIYVITNEKQARLAVGSIQMVKLSGEWNWTKDGKSVKIIYKPVSHEVALSSVKKRFEKLVS